MAGRQATSAAPKGGAIRPETRQEAPHATMRETDEPMAQVLIKMPIHVAEGAVEAPAASPDVAERRTTVAPTGTDARQARAIAEAADPGLEVTAKVTEEAEMLSGPHDDVQTSIGLDEVGNPSERVPGGTRLNPRRARLITKAAPTAVVVRPTPHPRPAIAAAVLPYRVIVAVGEGRPRAVVPRVPDAFLFLLAVPRRQAGSSKPVILTPEDPPRVCSCAAPVARVFVSVPESSAAPDRVEPHLRRMVATLVAPPVVNRLP